MPSNRNTSIATAQNTERSQRLLAAQSRLYSDAKHIHDARVFIVVTLAITTAILAITLPSARPIVAATGGTVAFLWSVVGSEREKRRRREASNVQEEFDTQVFALPWNEMAADRPSPTLIAEAAARYRGNRTRDWYPDTRNVIRPLDVLICQRSNLGWGASMHRFYAACLTSCLIFIPAFGIAVSLLAKLSVVDALMVVLVPFLAAARELIEMIRANRESGETKAKTEAKILTLWNKGMQDPSTVTIDDCRAVQDRILSIRQSNAHVPDWLDGIRRNRNEALMQQSAEHLIEDAALHGRIENI
ncbi:S-4TM family putative pore-forming effector [Streptomyces goshikiensis]|uniref:S-4TM family putative pore-forming effector n=1 Tax=Streptomyces goshikiensis TaxID=1942 RepID=UPI0036777B7A